MSRRFEKIHCDENKPVLESMKIHVFCRSVPEAGGMGCDLFSIEREKWHVYNSGTGESGKRV